CAVILFDQREGEVDARRDTGRCVEPAIFDVEHVRIHAESRIALGNVGHRAPMRGHAPAIEETGGRQPVESRAHTRHPSYARRHAHDPSCRALADAGPPESRAAGDDQRVQSDNGRDQRVGADHEARARRESASVEPDHHHVVRDPRLRVVVAAIDGCECVGCKRVRRSDEVQGLNAIEAQKPDAPNVGAAPFREMRFHVLFHSRRVARNVRPRADGRNDIFPTFSAIAPDATKKGRQPATFRQLPSPSTSPSRSYAAFFPDCCQLTCSFSPSMNASKCAGGKPLTPISNRSPRPTRACSAMASIACANVGLVTAPARRSVSSGPLSENSKRGMRPPGSKVPSGPAHRDPVPGKRRSRSTPPPSARSLCPTILPSHFINDLSPTAVPLVTKFTRTELHASCLDPPNSPSFTPTHPEPRPPTVPHRASSRARAMPAFGAPARRAP